MIINYKNINDIVAIFNTEDMVRGIRKETININGAEVTCWETGLIERTNAANGETILNFGGKKARGYLGISCNGKSTFAHVAIYTAFYGEIPTGMQVDHIDGDKQNNAAWNLRLATRAQNIRGFRTKPKGKHSQYRWITKNPPSKKWRASVDGSHVGYFDCEKEAAQEADKKALELGYFKEALNFQ